LQEMQSTCMRTSSWSRRRGAGIEDAPDCSEAYRDATKDLGCFRLRCQVTRAVRCTAMQTSIA
jgi:hypothetical protein